MNSVPKGRHRRRSRAVGVIVWAALLLLSAAIVYGLIYLLIGVISAWGTS